MNKNICLIGNPNCGKTTLFNSLTHSHQKVGNWAGVTVEKKEGKFFKDKNLNIIDLPGLYSLTARSLDEKVVVDYLKNSHIDLIVNIIDGTNLERSLYLTLSLIKLNIPIIVVVNMIDEIKKNRIAFNPKRLSDFLGVSIVCISAKNNIGISHLVDAFYQDIKPTKNKKLLELSNNDVYTMVDGNIDSIISNKLTLSHHKTKAIDKVLTNSFFGVVIFFVVIFLLYFTSLKVGGKLGDYIIEYLAVFSKMAEKLLAQWGVRTVAVDLLVNGVIKGIGSVLSFLPHLLIMFLIMTILEESGYTSRVAYLFDRIFSKYNLSGKSVIPFVLCCGCTTTGIEASKIIEDRRERENTILLSPFLPCGAKTAVFGWFSYVFFDGNALVSLFMYSLSIVVLLIVAKFLKTTSKTEGGFILELPVFRLPKIKDILSVLWLKVKEFLLKSGSVIFAISIIVWLMLNFGFNGYTYKNVELSFLYYIGDAIKYLFYPLGFCSWEASVSIITGLLAKEGIVETLEIISLNPQSLFMTTQGILSFMAFNLLCPPCVASISVAKRELKSVKKVFKMMGIEFLAAYGVSLVINFVGNIINHNFGLILSLVIGIIIGIGLFFSVKSILKNKCCNCKGCKNSNEIQNNVRLYERIGNGARRCVFSRRVDGR